MTLITKTHQDNPHEKHDRLVQVPQSKNKLAFLKMIKMPAECNDVNFIYNLPATVECLQFPPDSKFNQPIASLPPNLQKLVLGDHFNQPLQLQSSKLKIIEFSDNSVFNSDFDLHATCVETVEFGVTSQFNQIPVFPKTIKSIAYGLDFDQFVIYPEGLVELIFGDSFDQPLALPTTLEILGVGELYMEPLTNLPASIKSLRLPGQYSYPITQFPPDIVDLQFGDYNHPINFETLKKLYSLDVGDLYNHAIILPPSLRILRLGYMFNSPVNLSALTSLTISEESFFNHPLVLPETLKYLYFNYATLFNHPITLPRSLVVFQSNGAFNHPLVLPQRLLKLSLDGDFDKPLNFPPTLNELYIGRNSKFAHPLDPSQFPPKLQRVRILNNLTPVKINLVRCCELSTIETVDNVQLMIHHIPLTLDNNTWKPLIHNIKQQKQLMNNVIRWDILKAALHPRRLKYVSTTYNVPPWDVFQP